MKIVRVPLVEIRCDKRAQPRVKLDHKVIKEYAENMLEGANFPPVTLFHDGEHYWLADGFMRVKAARLAGRDSIDAEVHEGGLRQAILFSTGANAYHGYRRTRAEQRRMLRNTLKWLAVRLRDEQREARAERK